MRSSVLTVTFETVALDLCGGFLSVNHLQCRSMSSDLNDWYVGLAHHDGDEPQASNDVASSTAAARLSGSTVEEIIWCFLKYVRILRTTAFFPYRHIGNCRIDVQTERPWWSLTRPLSALHGTRTDSRLSRGALGLEIKLSSKS